jgi:hypothetical protein
MTILKQTNLLAALLLTITTLCLAGCAATSVKQTWKAPDYNGGPVKKVAVLVVEERTMIRQGLENRFRNQMKKSGQDALVSHELLSLHNIKEDKQAAGARLIDAGADTILVMRLVDSHTQTREVRATPGMFVPVITDTAHYGWYQYYDLAFMDMGTVWNSLEQNVFLESGLFSLTDGKRLWHCLTQSVLRENMDRLDEADVLVSKVLAAMRNDGLIHP